MKPEPIIDQPAAERCQEDLRQALGRPDLPVIDVMVSEGAILTERIASLEGAAPTQSLYAWYMGDGDVLIVAAPSLEAARVAGRAKIREIYLETMWERTYQILAGECVRMEPGSAIFVDHEDISWAEHAAFLAARKNREVA